MLEACEAEALEDGASEAEARAAVEAQVPDWGALASELQRVYRPPRQTRAGRVTGGSTMLSGLEKDLAAAFRSLGKNRGFSLTVVATLGLAIGANTAMFSMVDAVLLKPLPYERPDRLVRIFSTHPERPLERMGVSPGDVADWRRGGRGIRPPRSGAWRPTVVRLRTGRHSGAAFHLSGFESGTCCHSSLDPSSFPGAVSPSAATIVGSGMGK